MCCFATTVPGAGFEPAFAGSEPAVLPIGRSRNEVERVTGFEPVFPVWETGVLPLDDTRVSTSGGIRTLATRVRAGCSANELRRRVLLPPLGERAACIHHCDSVVREHRTALSGHLDSNQDRPLIKRELYL